MSHEKQLSPFSRRSFLQMSAVASAALAGRIVTEPMLAYAQLKSPPKGGVLLNANENPLGPAAVARQAVADITPDSGRYLFRLTEELVSTFAQQQGLKPGNVAAFAGSSPALHYAVAVFASPKASYVVGDPGYEAGSRAAEAVGARVVNVPLTKTWSHDVKAMLAAAPDAGIFYVCSPNNPTGTLTSHADIEYLLEHKPKGSLVMVDEAYIHFCDAPTTLDLVKADKDIIVLRTFSKLYGMAGLRCGFAVGRPDLIKKITAYGGYNPMPVTGVCRGHREPQRCGPDSGTQAHQHGESRVHICLARPKRLRAHAVGVELLHGQHGQTGGRRDRRHGAPERVHRTAVAVGARLGAGHGGHARRDGALPGGVSGGHEGRNCGTAVRRALAPQPRWHRGAGVGKEQFQVSTFENTLKQRRLEWGTLGHLV